MQQGISPKTLKTIGLCIVIGGMLAGIIFAVLTHGKTRVTLVPLPDDATITMDGQPARAGGQYIKTGKHTLTVSRQYFTTVTVNINTDDKDFERTIYLLPKAESDDAFRWLRDNPEVQQAREGVIGAEIDKTGRELSKKYPLMSELPYKTLDYTIGYTFDKNNEIIYTIELFPVATQEGTTEYKVQLLDFRDDALAYLKSKDVDTKKAKIEVTPDPDKL